MIIKTGDVEIVGLIEGDIPEESLETQKKLDNVKDTSEENQEKDNSDAPN